MVYTISGQSITVSKDEENVWKQLLLSFLACIPFFTFGIESTSLTSSAHSGHFLGLADDVPWTTTALIVAAAVSAPIYCYVIDRYGRLVGIFVINLMQGASCIPLFLPPNVVNDIILHVLAGISSGGLFTVLPAYLTEISSMQIRGVTASMLMMMTTAGYLMKLVVNTEVVMYTMVGLVMLQIVNVMFLLESPCYLVKVGKMERAKTNLAKLKCINDDNLVISNEIAKLKDESDRANSNGKLNLLRILKNKIYRDATKIGILLTTTMTLCGDIVFLDQQKTLMQLKIVDEKLNLLVLVCMFLGSLMTVVLMRVAERRYLLTVGYTAMVMSMGVLGVFTQVDLTVASLRWLPVVALGVLVLSYGLSWGLPTVIMAEIFNFEIKATLLGVLYTYGQLLKLLHIHTFKYVEEHMGIYTVFYVFACINMYGAVYTLFAVPNIKDKTVKQIERQLKRVPLLKFNTAR